MKMNTDQQMEALRGYYAAISFMDDQLGRVLGALDRLGLRENTVVVFLGDHGWHLGEHTIWQKRSLMEESAKVPLLMAAPGRRARGAVCRSLVELVDLYPTLAGICGLTPPGNLEGRSLASLLDDARRPHKEAAFTQLDAGAVHGRSARTSDFRYIRWTSPEGTAEELYDHRADPREFTNRAADAGYARVLERHRALIGAPRGA
jgi:arylsulfatase A-like enzyme